MYFYIVSDPIYTSCLKEIMHIQTTKKDKEKSEEAIPLQVAGCVSRYSKHFIPVSTERETVRARGRWVDGGGEDAREMGGWGEVRVRIP